MLLALTLENYRSFAHESTLDLMKRSFRRNVPADGDWAAVTERAAGIYGANASGKTTVLLCLSLLQVAVEDSLRDPGATRNLYDPHALHGDTPTKFLVEYVEEGIRYRWALHVTSAGIEKEELEANEAGHFRRVFLREGNTIRFGPQSGIPRAARENIAEFLNPWTLALSALAGARSRGPYGGALTWWRERLSALSVLSDRTDTHRAFMNMLKSPSWLRASSAIIQAADTGVRSVRVDAHALPPEIARRVHAINQALAGEDAIPEELDEEELKILAHTLVFTHGEGEESFELPEGKESHGTRAWFDLAMQATYTIATGGVLSVDEADESLHPLLLGQLVRLFTDERTNVSGAQLVFTSHDATVMGNVVESGLGVPNFWLTEKSDGVSELIALDEFPHSPNHNIERRYLRGVYGAVPSPWGNLSAEILRLRSEYQDYQRSRWES